MAQFSKNGAVQLYHDNELRFRTSTTGIDVLGQDDDGTSDNTANIRIIAEGTNEIVTLRSNNGVAQYISRNGDNYGTHLFSGFGTVDPNTVNMLQLTSTGHTFYQDLDVQGTLIADDIALHTGSNSHLIFQSPDGSHGYRVRANVSNSADYGFYIEDIVGTDILTMRSGVADALPNVATFHRGILEIKNAGTQSQLRLYCEDSNAHYVSLQAPPHSDFSGNQTLTLPAKTGTLISTGNSDTPTTTTSSSDADFVLIDDGGTMKKISPSNLGIGGGSGSITVQDEGNTLSTAATTLNFVGAGVSATGTTGTKTITISGGGGGGSGGTTSETWGASLNGQLNIYQGSAPDANIVIGSNNVNSASQPIAGLSGIGIENTVVGHQAGLDLTTGYENVLIGNKAGKDISTGFRNTIMGSEAFIDANGEYNTVVGFWAMRGTAGGNYNTVYGQQALSADLGNNTNNVGENNVVIGRQALYRGDGHTNVLGNIAIGYQAGTGNQSGDFNINIGYNSTPYYSNSYNNLTIGYQARNGHTQNTTIGYRAAYSTYNQHDYCTLIGGYAGYDMDGGDNCVYIGYYAGYGGGTGGLNTACGNYSQRFVTSATRNTSFGYLSMASASSGSYNSSLGFGSAGGITTGNYNTAVGYNALNDNTNDYTGDNNVCLGNAAMPSSASVSNEITLGDSSISTLRCQVQTISSLSDQRDKTAIEDLDLGLDFIKAMKPRKFAWNRRDGKWHGKKEVGFIAQELHEVEMDFNSTDRTRLVSYENPSKLEARPMNTYPILVKAIQELSAKVDSLQAKITKLEGA